MNVIVPGEARIAPDYPERLAVIRRRRRNHLFSMIFLAAFLPLGLWLGPKIGMPVWAVLTLAWFLMGVAWFRVRACRCPRCEQRFFRIGLKRRSLEPACTHCGLGLDGPERRIVLSQSEDSKVGGRSGL